MSQAEFKDLVAHMNRSMTSSASEFTTTSQYLGGDQVIRIGHEAVILFEACEWCGSRKGIRNGTCRSCGGPL